MFKRIVRNKNFKYNIMFVGNKIGLVSNARWFAYCEGVLHQLMADNKEVFERMKFK